MLSVCKYSARAEIVKTFTVDCAKKELCLYWWPKLPTEMGWHSDIQANYQNRINVLIPDGYNVSNANTIIYGNAIYKPQYFDRATGARTLDRFIEDDKATFLKRYPKIVIRNAESAFTSDGRILRAIEFLQPSENVWERVTYGEEGDYYILFVLTSRSESGYRKALPVYEDIIRRYR